MHVDHPDVDEHLAQILTDVGATRMPKRVLHAERLRAAGRAAAHRAVDLVLPDRAADGVLRLVHDHPGAPRMQAHRRGLVVELPVGLSITHGAEWGAALVWRQGGGQQARPDGGAS